MQNNPHNGGDSADRWVVLAAAVPILALVMGQLVNGLSVYFVPLETEFGWTRGDIALINSLGLVGLALGSILMGFAADRFGVRRVAFLGIVVTGVTSLAASLANDLWQLYALFFIAGVLGGGAISAPLMALVGSWFTRGGRACHRYRRRRASAWAGGDAVFRGFLDRNTWLARVTRHTRYANPRCRASTHLVSALPTRYSIRARAPVARESYRPA
ncbi:MAG: MFS transporter [Proteobacteria bacterium]|nr:MFS transporter [Pseudomonadota bacterium]